MATYKLGFLLKQDQAGSENAKVKIEMDGSVLVAEQEISQTSATWFPFDWTSSKVPNADGSVKARIKITFLNDYYVDADTDRNVTWQGFGYAYQDPGSSTYIKTNRTFTYPVTGKRGTAEFDGEITNGITEGADGVTSLGDVNGSWYGYKMTEADGTVTDFTDRKNFTTTSPITPISGDLDDFVHGADAVHQVHLETGGTGNWDFNVTINQDFVEVDVTLASVKIVDDDGTYLGVPA